MDTPYQYVDDLIQRAKKNDTEALRLLTEYYDPLIQASIIRCLRKDNRLVPFKEDLQNDAFLAMKKVIDLYDEGLSFFSYYVSKNFEYILMNICRKQYLNQLNEISLEELSYGTEPEGNSDPFLAIECRVEINKAINLLTSSQREAIVLYFFEGYNQDEAAALLGITQASFSKRVQRAVEALRDHLSDDFSLF